MSEQPTPHSPWIAQVKGDPDSKHWEISVVRLNNTHGRASWGWFDENKLLVSHNGGPCHWPLVQGLGPVMVQMAHAIADELNQKESCHMPRTTEFFLGVGAAVRSAGEFTFVVSDMGVVVLAVIGIMALCIGLYERH